MKLANGKPIALGEIGSPPSPEILADQNNWTWFMPWGNLVLWGNGPEAIKELFEYEKVLTKDEVILDKMGNYSIQLQEIKTTP